MENFGSAIEYVIERIGSGVMNKNVLWDLHDLTRKILWNFFTKYGKF